jgi:hypothetical protein
VIAGTRRNTPEFPQRTERAKNKNKRRRRRTMLLMYWPMIVWLGTLEAAQDAILKATRSARRLPVKVRK